VSGQKCASWMTLSQVERRGTPVHDAKAPLLVCEGMSMKSRGLSERLTVGLGGGVVVTFPVKFVVMVGVELVLVVLVAFCARTIPAMMHVHKSTTRTCFSCI